MKYSVIVEVNQDANTDPANLAPVIIYMLSQSLKQVPGIAEVVVNDLSLVE